MRGLIMIDRSILDHPVVGLTSPKRLAAWLWMLSEARWKLSRFDVAGRVIDVDRGQFVTSIRRMAASTGLSEKEVRTLFSRLEAENMVQKTGIPSGTGRGTGSSLVTICNYDEYQDFDKYRAQVGAQVGAHQGHTKGTQKKPEGIPEGIPEEKTSVQVADYSGHFSDFWEAYPHRNGNKKNRKGAEAAFSKAIKSGATPQQIAVGVDAMHSADDVRRGYARDPTTWLNQQGWKDEISKQPDFTAGGNYDPRNQSNSTATRPGANRATENLMAGFAAVAARHSGPTQ
jgi:hypothetical protein